MFFWGSRIGDIGAPTASEFTTTAAGDVIGIVAGGLGPATGIEDPRDIDRSGLVTAAGDRGAAAANIGSTTRLSLGTGGPFAPASATAGVGDATLSAAIASALAIGLNPASATTTQAEPGFVEQPSDANADANSAAAYFGELALDARAASAVSIVDDWTIEAIDLDDDWVDELTTLAKLD